MSAVNEAIVREYFESLGFLVRQPRKYQVSARPKHIEEEVDLLVVNPAASTDQPFPQDVFWSARELQQVSRAIVGVRGWHTERFSPAVIELSPEIFRFAEGAAFKNGVRDLGPGPVAKVLCIPDIAATGPLRDKVGDLFRSKGIDGVILFRTMLRELADYVDSNKNYEKSDLLQTIRLLKNYNLLKDAQMELFHRKRKARKTD